jgi:hypothetical protein
VTGIAGWALARLWVVVYSAGEYIMLVRLGEAWYGSRHSEVFRECYTGIGDLGRDFGILIGDDLDGNYNIEGWW